MSPEATCTRLVSPKAAREMCGGISASTYKRLLKAGDFPESIVLSSDRHGRHMRTAHSYEALLAWIAERISRHHQGAP